MNASSPAGRQQPADRVPWNQLIAYGMGGVVPIALFNIAGQLIGLLGNISLGLNPFWLGAVLVFPRLWDAISDPVVGHLSDNTRGRWGRRRPYILVGGIAVAVSFVAMWWVPRGDWFVDRFSSETAYNLFQFAFILIGVLVFYTACTLFEIPHGALGMEMSRDYHERTRLFSAKSFLGNLFAMGTPWLIALASLEFFQGRGGDLIDGMRYVSLMIAGVLIPLTLWWFAVLREPGFAHVEQQAKTNFWHDMRWTLSNKTFLWLVAIVFTLATGFNFVNLFGYYISIFYLFGGREDAAAGLLGINGTVWAVTGLLAVFPLNWISRAVGKNKTLLLAILLMCIAQLAKIVCYDPSAPYLILIPTVFLSAGMLMFFTLGSSMVGDICDEDELVRGVRSEGSYYSVYWWFIKMGMAIASLVTGYLLTYTLFDEAQNVTVEKLRGRLEVLEAQLDPQSDDAAAGESAPDRPPTDPAADPSYETARSEAVEAGEQLRQHWLERMAALPEMAPHLQSLVRQLDVVQQQLDALPAQRPAAETDRAAAAGEFAALRRQADNLKQQAPTTLWRLRLVEIGLPLVLSVVSIILTVRYPLTEARCYEIKQALKRRRAQETQASEPPLAE